MTELRSVDSDALAAVVGGVVKRVDTWCAPYVGGSSRVERVVKRVFCTEIKGVYRAGMT